MLAQAKEENHLNMEWPIDSFLLTLLTDRVSYEKMTEVLLVTSVIGVAGNIGRIMVYLIFLM